jgi:hypothetical protein
MPLSRDLLYNTDLSHEDAVLALLDMPVEEGFSPGDMLEVVADDFEDADTGTPVPPGHYVITSAENGLVHIVQHNTERNITGGKEYAVLDANMEIGVVGGGIKVFQHLGEGRYRNSVKDPREIRAMFVKGYLKKRGRKGGGTDLLYARRSFKNFQSGNPNPEYPLNRRRQKRRAERARRKGIRSGTHVVRRRRPRERTR